MTNHFKKKPLLNDSAGHKLVLCSLFIIAALLTPTKSTAAGSDYSAIASPGISLERSSFVGKNSKVNEDTISFLVSKRILELKTLLEKYKNDGKPKEPQYLQVLVELATQETLAGQKKNAQDHIAEFLPLYKDLTDDQATALIDYCWKLIEASVSTPQLNARDFDWLEQFAKLYGRRMSYREPLSLEEQRLVDQSVDKGFSTECERVLRAWLESRETAFGKFSPSLCDILLLSMRLYRLTNDSSNYEKTAEQLMAIMHKHIETAKVWRLEDIIVRYIKLGKLTQAQKIIAEAEDLNKKSNGNDHFSMVNFYNHVASTYLTVNHLGDSERIMRKAARYTEKQPESMNLIPSTKTHGDDTWALARRIELRCCVNELMNEFAKADQWSQAEDFGQFMLESEVQKSGDSSILTNHARVLMAEFLAARSVSDTKLSTTAATERADKSNLLFDRAIASLKNISPPDPFEIAAAERSRRLAQQYPLLSRLELNPAIEYSEHDGSNVVTVVLGDRPVNIRAIGAIDVKVKDDLDLDISVDNRPLSARGLEILDAGKLERALNVFSNAFSASPSPEVCVGLGECLLLSGHGDAALQACNLALDLAPNNPQASSVRYLVIAKDQNEPKLPISAEASTSLDETSSDLESQLAQARTCLALEQYAKTVSILSRVIDAHPKCWRALHYRAAALTYLGDSIGAAKDKKQMDIIASSDEKPSGDIGSGYNIDGKAVCRQFPKTATMIGHFTNPKDRD